MTRLQAIMIGALLPLAFGQACGNTHQGKDSNSNWLRACAAEADCGGDQSCVCGVCTVPCEADSECNTSDGPSARCAAPDATTCAAAEAVGTEPVCVARCEQDTDCGIDLACSGGQCLSVVLARAARDGGAPDATTSDADSGTSTTPDEPDITPPEAPALVASTDPGCEPAEATREPCGGGDACPDGLVCHVDQTCIVPGQCDDSGRATLATVARVSELQVVADAVYVIEYSSHDNLGNDRADGVIRRIPLDGGPPTMERDGLYRPFGLRLDPDQVFWQERRAQSTVDGWVAARVGGGDAVPIAAYVNAQDDEYLYGSSDGSVFRVSKRTGLRSDIGAAPDAGVYGVDDERLYLVRRLMAHSMPIEGGALTMLPSTQPVDSFVVTPDALVYYTSLGSLGFEARLIPKDGSPDLLLSVSPEGYQAAHLVHRDHVYLLQWGEAQAEMLLQRAPLQPGETETLASIPTAADSDEFRAFGVSDAGVFYAVGTRLVRMVHPDAASLDPPQGAAGAPCFSDLACEEGLTCRNVRCRP